MNIITGKLLEIPLNFHQLSRTMRALYGKSNINSCLDKLTQTRVHKARNLGVIFDNHLSFNSQITDLSQSCFYHIRDLRRIRDSLDFKTASTIATPLVHSKLDYCNCLYYNLPAYEIQRLQYIQNSLAPAVSACLTNIKICSHISNFEGSTLAENPRTY